MHHGEPEFVYLSFFFVEHAAELHIIILRTIKRGKETPYNTTLTPWTLVWVFLVTQILQ
jgi:hypothetical protein